MRKTINPKMGARSRARVRVLVVWVTYAILFAVSGCGAFLLRFDFSLDAEQRGNLLFALAWWLPANMLAFRLLHLDRTMRRFASLPDLRRMATALFLAAAVCTAFIGLLRPGFPRSLHILQFVLNLLANCGLCVAARTYRETQVRSESPRGSRAIIYGAGSSGQKLARELRANPQLGYEVAGYVDDDPVKAKAWVNGFPVLGNGALLDNLKKKHEISTVLIAMPSADRDEMSRVLDVCAHARLRVKTIPSVSEIVEGRTLARQIREVQLEDLLGRTPIRLELEQIEGALAGQTVLVTGAAGSIGSELCRQIARFKPATLIAFDIAETALYYLELEMRERFPALPFLPEVGNICDAARLGEVFSLFQPAVVFHAAAYKHVPMMERHIFSAVENNVLGTCNVARLANNHQVGKFVMISTDKAVHPSSVMGVTKRIAELYINSLQARTKYVSVRFGNVLGSNGSVVPIFQKQIREGGPVTVTHPDMRRYFMTIPEASQLVLQAGAMGSGGEIFILDMGEPVAIAELARKLIRLSGLTPDRDIQIVYTGVRPGEKLMEELTGAGEDALPTCHEKIRVYQGRRKAGRDMREVVENLRHACARRDRALLLQIIRETVPDYRPEREEINLENETRTLAAGAGHQR